MNFKFAILAVAAISCSALRAQDAQRILEGARVAASLTVLDEGLNGRLSKGKIPIVLFLKGKEIQFKFNEKGGDNWDTFHMRLGENSYDLFEIDRAGKTTRFPDAKIVTPIAGSDLTYEDLSFRFFYWPNPTYEGTEDVNGQPCYKIRVNKPKGAAGKYDNVYIWVHTKYGAFMQVKGFDKGGKLVKEFVVEDVMKVSANVWSLKKMQVSTYNAAGDRRASSTDVIFDTPKVGGPKGLPR